MACVTFPYFLYLYMKNLLWNPGKLGSQSHINLVFPNEGKEAISSLLHEILDKRHFIRLWQSKLRTTCVPTSASSEKKFGILKRIIRICLMKRSLTRRFSLKWCMRYSLSSLKRSIKKKSILYSAVPQPPIHEVYVAPPRVPLKKHWRIRLALREGLTP